MNQNGISENDLTAFKKIVAARRSIRIFDKNPLPIEVINSCIDMALIAPNSSNLQPWEFYLIRSTSVREQLNAAFLSQPAATTCGDLIISVARTKTWKRSQKQMLELFATVNPPPPQSVQDYYKKLVPLVYNNGPFGIMGFVKRALFFLRGLKTPTPRQPVSENEMRLWAVKTCALACENLMLALSAHGYDSCPMEGFDSARVRKILRLPSDAVVVMGIAAGTRKPEGLYGQQIRFERSQFVKEI
jgi:nitroreductase